MYIFVLTIYSISELFSVSQLYQRRRRLRRRNKSTLFYRTLFTMFYSLFGVSRSTVFLWILFDERRMATKQQVLSASARHLIVYWFVDKAEIMLILENLRFLLFSHFMILPPILLHLQFFHVHHAQTNPIARRRKNKKNMY